MGDGMVTRRVQGRDQQGDLVTYGTLTYDSATGTVTPDPAGDPDVQFALSHKIMVAPDQSPLTRESDVARWWDLLPIALSGSRFWVEP